MNDSCDSYCSDDDLSWGVNMVTRRMPVHVVVVAHHKPTHASK